MKDLVLGEIEISGVLDKDGESRVLINDSAVYLNKAEMQRVINHLSELLKS